MPRKNLSLGDLHEMMDKYKRALAEAKATQRLKRDGNLQTVDDAQIKRAIAALETAMSEVEEICEDGVLAIVLDS